MGIGGAGEAVDICTEVRGGSLQHGPGSQGDHSGPEGGGIFRAMQQLVAGVFKGNSKEGIVRGGIGGVGNGCGVAGGGTSGTAEAGDRDRAGEAEVLEILVLL